MSTSSTGVEDRALVRRAARGPVNRNEVLLEVRDLRGRLVPLDTVTSSVARVARVAGWATYVDLTVSVSSATTGATVGLVTVTATPSQAALLPSLGQWYLSLSGSSWTKTIVSGEFRHSGPTDPEVCGQVTCGCG